MWTVVYTAKNDTSLDFICAILDQNGILCRTCLLKNQEDTESEYCDVLVPAAEVQMAHALILDENL